MLFNSYTFLFLFLPIALMGYYLLGKLNKTRLITVWLVGVSLLFYAWTNPCFVVLLVASVMLNYTFGMKLVGLNPAKNSKLVLASGVAFNLLLLGYFKYTNFLVGNINAQFDLNFHVNTIMLPLAISFFTLQQIAYLVDLYRGERIEHGFWEYCLFVMFFPKLLSGPIVRLKEIMPQIGKDCKPYLTSPNIAVGLTTFILGLFKKVILADNVGIYAAPIFEAAASGISISFIDAWSGALAYTFQLYFDFSGYCDMAIGLGLMFGIRLPLNFYSPYKATSIKDFWSRWHMTLSRYIRDYLYIPLGGNRKGLPRQMINLMVVMAIAGLWHGSGWTFIFWGALHGLYLVINHCWRQLRQKLGKGAGITTRWGTVISTLITFIAVTVAWVFFRADSIKTATDVLKSMAGLNGLKIPIRFYPYIGDLEHFLEQFGITFGPQPYLTDKAVTWIFVSVIICWFLPNVQEYMCNFKPALDGFQSESKKDCLPWLRWQPRLITAVFVSGIVILIILNLNHVNKFIYFQF